MLIAKWKSNYSLSILEESPISHSCVCAWMMMENGHIYWKN